MAYLAALLLSVGLPLAAPAAAPEPAPPAFGEEIAVRLFTVVVRVVDAVGKPLLGLTPEDFRLRVGKQAVPVTAVDWYSSGEPSAPRAAPEAEPPANPETQANTPNAENTAGAGKLVVIFVEADNNEPGRVRGHLRTLPFTRDLLAALRPEDRVAVVSFDSHLKLWQDFTREREPVHAAIYQAIHFGGRPPMLPGPPHLDAGQAAAAASPERALEVVAAALAPLPGEKVLVFLGWGLGCFSSFGTQMTPAFAPAVRALKAARVTVFVLDVTEAASHDLEVGLQDVAAATGGTYDKTFLFPNLAIAQLAQTISGYYVLTLDREALPARGGGVTVELARRRGTVLLRPTSIR